MQHQVECLTLHTLLHPSLVRLGHVLNNKEKAQMAELVDALVSGTSVRKNVQVRVLFWAHEQQEQE